MDPFEYRADLTGSFHIRAPSTPPLSPLNCEWFTFGSGTAGEHRFTHQRHSSCRRQSRRHATPKPKDVVQVRSPPDPQASLVNELRRRSRR